MKNSLLYTLLCVLTTLTVVAQPVIDTEGKTKGGIDTMSVIIGLVIGLIIGYLVAGRLGKK